MPREMKDSGIEWIGEIPAEWEIIRFKFLHNVMNTGEAIDKEYWSDDEKDTVFYTAGLLPIYTSYHDFPEWKYTNGNDLLLARNGTPYVYYPVINACYTDHIIRAEMKADINRKFVKYGLQQSISSVIVNQVSIATWSASLWNEQTIPWPPLSEQQKISAHLDSECAKIDDVITKTKTTIEEYKKLKQSVITETVTKGIRPNREMKDSGIEWIGEIPKEWDVKVAFQLFSQVKNKNEGLIEKNLLSLSYGKIKRKSIDTIGGLLPENFDGYNIIEKDDIVLRLTDLQNDHTSLRVGLSNERGIVTSAYLTLRNYSNNMPLYLYYYLHSYDIYKGFYGMGAGVRQGLNWDGVKLLKIVLPPVEEQIEITDYLEKQVNIFDTLIAKKEQIAAELESYKKSLIYEYVTGKKEVI